MNLLAIPDLDSAENHIAFAIADDGGQNNKLPLDPVLQADSTFGTRGFSPGDATTMMTPDAARYSSNLVEMEHDSTSVARSARATGVAPVVADECANMVAAQPDTTEDA
jgi:hypothetical protein